MNKINRIQRRNKRPKKKLVDGKKTCFKKGESIIIGASLSAQIKKSIFS